MNRVLIDGDVLVYSVANASDSHARKECEAQGVEFTPEPISHVLHSLKLMVTNITEGFSDYTVYLSSLDRADNFRYDRYPRYKEKRPKAKPTHFLACREYLQSTHGAVVARGEADDALAEALFADYADAVEQATFFGEEDAPFRYCTVTCASVDKDLRMVPGQHWNWRKPDELGEVTPDQGWRHFMHQLLTGDAVDSIPGLHRVGGKTANKILGDAVYPEDLLRLVIEAYANKGESLSNMRRNADLLWMRVDARTGDEVLAEVIPESEQDVIWKETADAKMQPKPKRGKSGTDKAS